MQAEGKLKASLTATNGSVYKQIFCCWPDCDSYVRTLVASCVASGLAGDHDL